MELVINLDILFLNDLAMTLVLLWAVAKFAGIKFKFWRLVLGGIIGALYTVVLVLPVFRWLPMELYIIFHFLLNLGVAYLMILAVFGRLSVRKCVKVLGYLYLVTFLAGGAALSIYFVTGSSPVNWLTDWINLGDSYAWFYLLAVMVAIGVGKFGRNIIREKLHRERYNLRIRVWLAGQSVEIQGLVDTGNLLRDPVSKLPVIVVERAVLMPLFPPEVQAILSGEGLDVIDKVDHLLHTTWYSRFRIIPFASIGKEGGLLIGCKPDNVEVLDRATQEMQQVILGLHEEKLNLEGDYQALLHPELFEAM